MTEAQILELLQESESTSLDFKREQYRFVGAPDTDKAALLKDVLAFANSFRRTEAVILIGIAEQTDGTKSVVGINDHLKDADLQQFVNSKTNRPLSFSYEAASVQGKSVGVVRIPIQPRPFLLKAPFGGIPAGVVFYRQSSSNAVADPETIALMGRTDGAGESAVSIPKVQLALADPESRDILGVPIHIERDWYERHTKNDFDDFETTRGEFYLRSPLDRDNSDYWRELADYLRIHRMAFPVLWRVENTGTLIAKNVIVTVVGDLENGEEAFETLPSLPETRDYMMAASSLHSAIARANPNIQWVNVEYHGTRWRVEARIGDIQPGSSRWSNEAFFLAWRESGERSLKATITADNLPTPLVFDFALELEIESHPAVTQEDVEGVYYEAIKKRPRGED